MHGVGWRLAAFVLVGSACMSRSDWWGEQDIIVRAGDSDDGPCHGDEVYVGGVGVCIDRYEASNDGSGGARSAAGVLPWVSVTWGEASAACAAAGKTLCDVPQWQGACEGELGWSFPYGDIYEPGRCNGANAPTGGLVVTGAMADCEGGIAGLFDMSGNASEWTSTCDSGFCEVKSGTTSDVTYLACAQSILRDTTIALDYIGFRCCRQP